MREVAQYQTQLLKQKDNISSLKGEVNDLKAKLLVYLKKEEENLIQKALKNRNESQVTMDAISVHNLYQDYVVTDLRKQVDNQHY